MPPLNNSRFDSLLLMSDTPIATKINPTTNTTPIPIIPIFQIPSRKSDTSHAPIHPYFNNYTLLSTLAPQHVPSNDGLFKKVRRKLNSLQIPLNITTIFYDLITVSGY